ncbi:MAG: hypothetical protein ACYTGN_16825 [Planctomycetota bacterium]|jgi:hypothetical protein
MTDAINKLIAALLIIFSLLFLLSGAGDEAGAFGTLWHWALGVFLVATGVGFWRYRGWAFLVVSVLLLAGWVFKFVNILIAADRGTPVMPWVMALLANMALIAWLGRWAMEKRFRPHLDVEH